MLVLLERRGKYKCAKCGKLFFQKEIESQTFQRWNQKQREIDLHNIKLEDKRPKLSEEEKKIRAKQYRLKNIEKYLKYSREYYEANKEKILQQRKVYRQLTKEARNECRRRYRQKSLENTRLLNRINYYRREQVKLAQQELKINDYKPYTNGLDDSFSTFGLSYLLNKTENLKTHKFSILSNGHSALVPPDLS